MIVALASLLIAVQCPDGSPPPCRAGARAAAPMLALSDQTWLVLPFENTTRATDAELIRQASVPQLYAEMSRWTGVRVISDARVADLIQQLPAAQRDRLGLEAARGLARRVGAGRVVLGGYLAAGGRANITATVYETRTGREVRVVRDPIAGFQTQAALDSLSASFGRLARGILDVPAGSVGASSAGVGTSSIEAYRAYVSGLDALNHINLDSAMARFDRAIAHDPNFAMPYFQRWRATIDSVAGRPFLESAKRLSARLPLRERTMMEAFSAAQSLDRDRLCSTSNQLVGLDSSDAEGWSLLSGCYRDPFLVLDNGVVRYRGDFNRALRAAERAYALAPTSLTGRSALLNALATPSFMQCVPPDAAAICPLDRYYRVSIIPSGDSVIAAVNLWSTVRHAPPDLTPAAVEAQAQRYRRAAAICERMADESNVHLLHQQTAALSLLAGDILKADERFGRGIFGPFDSIPVIRIGYLQGRFEVALARERLAEVHVYADSFFARPNIGSAYRSMLGYLSETDTSAAGRQNAMWRQILVGVLPPGFDSLERVIGARLEGPQRDDFFQISTLAGFHLRRTGPALDTAARHPLKRFQAWFARGERARARAALAEFDRELVARHVATSDDGGWLFSAESHVELGDTATALERMRQFGQRWATSIPGAYILEMRLFQSTTPRLWGRAWLLYGDLATARGQSGEARRAYRMVVGLWERGEPVVQPSVTRARAALAQLGG